MADFTADGRVTNLYNDTETKELVDLNSNRRYIKSNNKGFDIDGSIDKDHLKDIMLQDMILNSTDNDWLNKFSRFGYIDPYNTHTCSREYLFITKPDLHLFENYNPYIINKEIGDDTYFTNMFSHFRHLMEQLQYSVKKEQPFLAILFNSMASTLDLPDIVGLESDTNENIYGDKITYRHGSTSGDVGHEFSLEFFDTKYLEIYNLFKIWDMYENYKTRGLVTPPNESYIRNMELHDQVSIYKFIVADDMETILFYAKLYGVYPKGVPRSQFGSLDNGPIKLNVDFKSAFVIDNDPYILDDFNKLMLSGTSYKEDDDASKYMSNLKAAKIWNKDYEKIDKRFVGKPFVVLDSDIAIGDGSTGTKGVFKLKWLEVD